MSTRIYLSPQAKRHHPCFYGDFTIAHEGIYGRIVTMLVSDREVGVSRNAGQIYLSTGAATGIILPEAEVLRIDRENDGWLNPKLPQLASELGLNLDAEIVRRPGLFD